MDDIASKLQSLSLGEKEVNAAIKKVGYKFADEPFAVGDTVVKITGAGKGKSGIVKSIEVGETSFGQRLNCVVGDWRVQKLENYMPHDKWTDAIALIPADGAVAEAGGGAAAAPAAPSLIDQLKTTIVPRSFTKDDFDCESDEKWAAFVGCWTDHMDDNASFQQFIEDSVSDAYEKFEKSDPQWAAKDDDESEQDDPCEFCEATVKTCCDPGGPYWEVNVFGMGFCNWCCREQAMLHIQEHPTNGEKYAFKSHIKQFKGKDLEKWMDDY